MHLLTVARCIKYVKNCMRGNRDNLSLFFLLFKSKPTLQSYWKMQL